MAKQNTKPIKNFRAGSIQASIWRKEVEKHGRAVAQFSVRVQKRFRKEDGSYENTDYFFPDDLPRLVLVAQKAYEYIALSQSQEPEDAVPV